MKNAKKIYILVTAIVIGILFTTSVVTLTHAGTQVWVWFICGCSTLVASILVWFSRDYLRLIEGLSFIIKRLGENKNPNLRKGDHKTIKILGDAIKQRFSDNDSHMKGLEKQVKELDINIRLSRRQKTNAEEIIYSIRDAVIVVDEFDKLLIANEAAGASFGFDYKKSLYKSIDEVVDNSKKEFVDLLKRSRQSKTREKKHEITFTENDVPKTYDCIISCVHDDKDKICGVVAVLHDITREKEISQMKNDFVSHVSHELKTPLASIMAYSEMLVDGEADDEETRNEFCSVIQNQAQRLNRLIEEILNISRIESGLIKVKKESVNLALLIEEQLKMIKSYAEEKNIKVIEPKTKDLIVFGQVYGDKDMLSQVVVNLLSNAVKYTPSGGSIRIDSQIDDVGKIARIAVTDTGVGIPEEDIDHVFDKFFRVEANKNVAKGTGLGLNLVKQIVEKVHSGKVFVTSKRGEGSTFGFEIPLATTEVVDAG